MIRLLATAAVAALVLTPVVVGLGTASAGPAGMEPAPQLRTASAQEPAPTSAPAAVQQVAAPVAAAAGCARTVRVVGAGYGEPVVSTCRAPGAAAPARP
jgi:hypothetical protein